MGPRVVGRFHLQKTLGVGMFAKVVLAEDPRTGERVAVKIMRKEALEDLDMARYARREAFVLKRLAHPSIVEFVEAVQSDAKLFLVMRVAPGSELLDVVRDGPLHEDAARGYVRQLVDAVAYLHRRGVVHRDLKPENVMVDTASASLTLIDFGLTGLVRKDQVMHTVCGSSYYSAPEVTYNTGDGYDGTRADAWSVGILAYILLTGAHPYVGTDGELMVDAMRNGDLEIPPSLSRAATHFLARLLAVNPRQRYSMAQAAMHPWITGKPVPHSLISAHNTTPTSHALQLPAEEDDHTFMPAAQPRQQAVKQSRASSQRQEDAPLQAQLPKHLQLQLQGSPHQDTRALQLKSAGLDEAAGDRDRARGALYRNGSSTGLFRAATGAPGRRPGTFTGQFNAKPLFGRSSTGDQTGTSLRRTAQESGSAGKNPASSFLRFRRPSMGRHLGTDDAELVAGADDENLSSSQSNEDFKAPDEVSPARVTESTAPNPKEEPYSIRRQNSIRSRQRGLLSRFIEPQRH